MKPETFPLIPEKKHHFVVEMIFSIFRVQVAGFRSQQMHY
jgi:hypothetical protein